MGALKERAAKQASNAAYNMAQHGEKSGSYLHEKAGDVLQAIAAWGYDHTGSTTCLIGELRSFADLLEKESE